MRAAGCSVGCKRIGGSNTWLSYAGIQSSRTDPFSVTLHNSGPGVFETQEKFVVVPTGTNPAEVAGHEIIEIQDEAIEWNNPPQVLAQLQIDSITPAPSTSAGVQQGAVVLQSFDFASRVLFSLHGLDPDKRIRDPLVDMGYSVLSDYAAPAAKTLTDYVKGKQIWYSMSHGGTVDGTPYSEFTGLGFKDGGIRTTDLTPLNLNYRLVVVDGCVSAQTSTDSRELAKTDNALLAGSQAFADAFGPNVAYIGWAWEIGPAAAQTWSGELIRNLKGGRTVRQGYDLFQQARQNANEPAGLLMKLYGDGTNVIDLKANNP